MTARTLMPLVENFSDTWNNLVQLVYDRNIWSFLGQSWTCSTKLSVILYGYFLLRPHQTRGQWIASLPYSSICSWSTRLLTPLFPWHTWQSALILDSGFNKEEQSRWGDTGIRKCLGRRKPIPTALALSGAQVLLAMDGRRVGFCSGNNTR